MARETIMALTNRFQQLALSFNFALSFEIKINSTPCCPLKPHGDVMKCLIKPGCNIS
jgi:hypothetical protein